MTVLIRILYFFLAQQENDNLTYDMAWIQIIVLKSVNTINYPIRQFIILNKKLY